MKIIIALAIFGLAVAERGGLSSKPPSSKPGGGPSAEPSVGPSSKPGSPHPTPVDKAINAIFARESINAINAKFAKHALKSFRAKEAGVAERARNALIAGAAKKAENVEFATIAEFALKAAHATYAKYAIHAKNVTVLPKLTEGEKERLKGDVDVVIDEGIEEGKKLENNGDIEDKKDDEVFDEGVKEGKKLENNEDIGDKKEDKSSVKKFAVRAVKAINSVRARNASEALHAKFAFMAGAAEKAKFTLVAEKARRAKFAHEAHKAVHARAAKVATHAKFALYADVATFSGTFDEIKAHVKGTPDEEDFKFVRYEEIAEFEKELEKEVAVEEEAGSDDGTDDGTDAPVTDSNTDTDTDTDTEKKMLISCDVNGKICAGRGRCTDNGKCLCENGYDPDTRCVTTLTGPLPTGSPSTTVNDQGNKGRNRGSRPTGPRPTGSRPTRRPRATVNDQGEWQPEIKEGEQKEEQKEEQKRATYACEEEYDIDYPGNDIRTPKNGVTSYESCREYCTSVQGCKFWTYNTKRNNCYVKTTEDARSRAKLGWISGPKDCATKGKEKKLDSWKREMEKAVRKASEKEWEIEQELENWKRDLQRKEVYHKVL